MPKNWETKVVTATRSWNEPEMEAFLSFLEKRIGREEALKRIRSLSYFKDFRFKSFLERIRFYERYIGREGVNERLKRSLGGFHKNSVENIEANIKYIESYIGKEEVIKRMKKDLLGFSKLNLNQLKQKEEKWGEQKMKDMLEKYNLQNPIFLI